MHKSILHLIQDDVANLASDHETAYQYEAQQFYLSDSDPGKYAYPDKEAEHVGC